MARQRSSVMGGGEMNKTGRRGREWVCKNIVCVCVCVGGGGGSGDGGGGGGGGGGGWGWGGGGGACN